MPETATSVQAPPDARPIWTAGTHCLARSEKLGFCRCTRRRMICNDAVYAAHSRFQSRRVQVNMQNSRAKEKFASLRIAEFLLARLERVPTADEQRWKQLETLDN